MSVIGSPQNPNDPLSPDFVPAPPPRPRDQLSGHEYDGIQEYDNPTPGWWTAIFVVSVFFAFFYFVYYHSGVPERSIQDSYSEAVSADAKKTLAALGITQLTVTEASMVEWMHNDKYLAYGRSVFQGNCVSCHGNNGEGKIGPNFTDDYYKNITKLTDFPRVITTGANNGAMPAQSKLTQVDVALVAAYVASLRGQNLPSGSTPAQYGTVIAPWPTAAATSAPAK